MKFTSPFLSALLLLAPSSFTQAFGEEARQPEATVDYTKVNAAIDTALSEYLAGNTTFSVLKASIDAAKTDIAADTYGLNLQVTLPKPSYADQDLQIDAKLGFQSNLKDSSNQAIDLSVDATIKTDVLALLKLVVPALSRCDQAAKSDGAAGVVWARHCELIEQLPAITSIEELRGFLQNKLETHRSDLKAYRMGLGVALQQLRSRLSPMSLVAQRTLKQQKNKAQQVLKFFEQITIKGKGQSLSVQAPAYSGSPFISLLCMKLQINAQELVIKDKMSVDFGKIFYGATKPLLKDLLEGLEQNSETARDVIKAKAQIFGNLFSGSKD